MAAPIRSLPFRVHRSELRPVISAITCCVKAINPQSHNYSLIDPAPLNQFSSYLDDNLVLQVINAQSNPYHALFFFEWASNPFHYTPNNKCFAAILDRLLSRSLFAIASSLLESSGKLSDFMISKFVAANGDLGNVEAAIFWFRRAKTMFGDGRCLFSFNAVLGALVKANRIDLAQSLFAENIRSQSDVSTYTTMIRGFCKMGMVEKARKLFDEMPCKPNSVTCNTVIHGYCKKGDMDSAKVIFYRMINDDYSGCSPDTVTYTTLIDGYCKKGEFDEALKWKREMVNRGLQPNLLTYNALIYNLCLRGNVGEAKKLVVKMRLHGVKENIATHLSILKGLSIAGKSDELVQYFRDRFRKELMDPDRKAYAIVVMEYCKMKKPTAAISILKEMHAKGIIPDASSFNSVFRTLMELGMLDTAMVVLKQMKKMGRTPNFISYSTVITNLCTTNGRMKQVEKVVEDMRIDGILMDASIYSSVIWGYCEAGDAKMAAKVFGEAINNGHVVSLEAFANLVKRLSEKEVSIAQNLLQEMCKRCGVVDPARYQQVLGGSSSPL